MKRLISKVFTSTLLAALVGVLLGILADPVEATPLDDLEAQVAEQDAAAQKERDRIMAERREIEAEFAIQDKACFQKFAVTGCRDALRTQKRNALGVLRKQELAVNDAERLRRAKLQQERSRQRQIDEAARRASAANTAEGKPPREFNPPLGSKGSPQVDSDPREPPKPRAPYVRKPPVQVDRTAQDAEERARYERKQQEAADRKEAILKRLADRDPSKLPKPLPAPPSY